MKAKSFYKYFYKVKLEAAYSDISFQPTRLHTWSEKPLTILFLFKTVKLTTATHSSLRLTLISPNVTMVMYVKCLTLYFSL